MSNPPDPPLDPKWPGRAAFAASLPTVHDLLIIRHGESSGTLERRWQGWLDAPLTADGEKQAPRRAADAAHNGFVPA